LNIGELGATIWLGLLPVGERNMLSATTISRWTSFVGFAFLMILPLTGQATAQETRSKRIALVIGNSAYKNISPLVNPTNDATDIASKLKSLRFEVLLATDATQASMMELLQQFASRVTKAHVALVFYAGHGVTVSRESFLLPIDVPSTVEADANGHLRAETVNEHLVSMEAVLAPLAASKIGIVFLDACRTNAAVPGVGLALRVASVGTGRSVPVMRGTTSVDIKPSAHSAGVFRAYATQLDNVASDGTGRNSPFTKALLRHIGTQGLSIQELMIRVRRSVMEETAGQQIPWEEAALNEGFAFQEALPAARPTAKPGAQAPTGAGPAAKKGNAPPSVNVGTGF
jgi:uncharacterized caspase-like protein